MSDDAHTDSSSLAAEHISPVIPIQAPAVEAQDTEHLRNSHIQGVVTIKHTPTEMKGVEDKPDGISKSATNQEFQVDVDDKLSSLQANTLPSVVNAQESDKQCQPKTKPVLFYQDDDPWLEAFPLSALKKRRTLSQDVTTTQPHSNDSDKSRTGSPLMDALEESLTLSAGVARREGTPSSNAQQVRLKEGQSACGNGGEDSDNKYLYQMDSSETSECLEPLQLITPPSPPANVEDVTMKEDRVTIEILSSQEEDNVEVPMDEDECTAVETEEATVNQCEDMLPDPSTVAGTSSNIDEQDNSIEMADRDTSMEITFNSESTASRVDDSCNSGMFESTRSLLPAEQVQATDHPVLPSQCESLFKDPQVFVDRINCAKCAQKETMPVVDETSPIVNGVTVPSNGTTASHNEIVTENGLGGSLLSESHPKSKDLSSSSSQHLSQSQEINIEDFNVSLPPDLPTATGNLSLAMSMMSSEEDSEPVVDMGGFVVAHAMKMTPSQSHDGSDNDSEPHPTNDSQPHPTNDSHSSSKVPSVEILSESKDNKAPSNGVVSSKSPPDDSNESAVPSTSGPKRVQLCTQFLNKKDTTGNITMETPQHSQQPFQRRRNKAQTEMGKEFPQVFPPTGSPSGDGGSTSSAPHHQQHHPPETQSGTDHIPPHILKIIHNTWYNHTLMQSHQQQDRRSGSRLRAAGLLGL